MRVTLASITDVIRSKNAGPYELTFDIMFTTRAWFERAVAAGVFNTALICRLYRIPSEDVLGIIAYPPAKAIKVTIRRPICSGDIGETDVYGAQQHAPLLDLAFDL